LAGSGSAVAEAVGAEAGDGWLCCLPLHHVAGLAVVGRAWATGAPVVVHPRFDVDSVAAVAGALGPIYVSLVATMLTRLLDAGGPVERFQGILLGGGPIDPAVRERAEAAGAAVSTTYGMTETWGGIVHNGHPLREVELRLDSEDGDGGSGEILVRAAMVMRGYRLRPDLTSAALSGDGWYRTGDVGRFDGSAGGRLRLVDRLGDMIKTGGVKVAPTEVERVLATHPDVADVCVAARPDPEWGERVVAFVVPRYAGAPPALADLRAFVLEHLAAPKAPKEVVLVEAIPRSTGGKPLRRLLPG
jgi:O-succinylbenzoic acid--CoA ligase